MKNRDFLRTETLEYGFEIKKVQREFYFVLPVSNV